MISGFKQWLHCQVLNAWYGDTLWVRLLSPLSMIYGIIARRRKLKLLNSPRWEPPVPVVVVGNITVGGVGKTPVVASLVKAMQSRGFRPGIVSRGFGVKGQDGPSLVTPRSSPVNVGDEPVMLARQLNVPIAVDPDRVRAAKLLCEQHHCNLIIADDGLQHYNLKRHVEIVVIDGMRMLGNGLYLPAGPLREGPERLESVDLVLTNGEPMVKPAVSYSSFQLALHQLVAVASDERGSHQEAPSKGTVHGVAGIGNPERFFNSLKALGFDVIPHPYPDHHSFCSKDICFDDDLPVIMTAKDAVKCLAIANSRHWYLPVVAELPDTVLDQVTGLIEHSGTV